MTDLTLLSNKDVINLMYGKTEEDSFTIAGELSLRNDRITVQKTSYIGQDIVVYLLYKGLGTNYSIQVKYEKETYLEFIEKIERSYLGFVDTEELGSFKETIARLKEKRNK